METFLESEILDVVDIIN